MYLEVQARVWVTELRQQFQGLTARIQNDLGWISLHQEHIVNVGLGRAEYKWLGHVQREFVNVTKRDTGGVEGQVVGGGQLGLGAFNGRTVAEVEIAMETQNIVNYCAMAENLC